MFFGIVVHSVPDILIKRMAYSDFQFLHYCLLILDICTNDRFSMLRYSTYIYMYIGLYTRVDYS